MATFDQLRVAVRMAASRLAAQAPDLGAGKPKGKAYEVWVMLEIAKELRRIGLSVDLVNHDSTPAQRLRIRGSPGMMPSTKSSVGNAPGHLVIKGRRTCELHLGLQHGSSQFGHHEIDISLLPATQASDLREAGGGYYDGAPLLALELKAYDRKHKLDQSVARALVGVIAHLQPFWSVGFALFAARAGRWSRAWSRDDRPVRAGIVTTTTLYDNSLALLSAFQALSFTSVEPGVVGDAFERLGREIKDVTG